jgi:DNA-binding phage protein
MARNGGKAWTALARRFYLTWRRRGRSRSGRRRSKARMDRAAWRRSIRAAFGYPVEPFPWEEQPALAQLTLSTWSIMKPYAQNPNIRPFDFLLVATPSRSISDFASGYRACCANPRPSCFLFDDPAASQAQEWRCLRCAQPFPSRRFRSYGSVIHGTLDSFEVKRLCANGEEPGEHTMRGLTMPRPVRVEWITAIGKEFIVDPTETDEGLTAEMLSETSVLEDHDPAERLEQLRAAVREAGVKTIARESGLSPRHLREFVNKKTTPLAPTIAKIEAALAQAGQARSELACCDGTAAGAPNILAGRFVTDREHRA